MTALDPLVVMLIAAGATVLIVWAADRWLFTPTKKDD